MEKRNSLLVATDCSYHGTFNVAKMISLGLRGDFDVVFAVPGDENAAADLAELRDAGIRVVEAATDFENLERCAYDRVEAARIIEICAPDVILCCDGAQLYSQMALKQVAHEGGIPFLTIVNCLTADPFEQFPQWRERAERILASASAVILVSQALRKRLGELLDLPRRCITIPNFCRDAFFDTGDAAARHRLRQELRIPADALVCCTIGRIQRNKGQHLSLAALKELADRGRGPCYWLYIGRMEPWEREAFETALDNSRARDVVRVLGERSDIRDLLDASDVLALTSYTEGMPLVVIEALARGLPVVATAIDGVVEQIDDTCGVLLPAPEGQGAATIDALRRAVEGFLDDPARLSRMGNAARQRSELFKCDRAIASYRTAILAVTQDGPAEPKATPPDELRLASGSRLDLTDPAHAWNWLGYGWLRCEPDGTPSEGERSELRLRFSASDDRVRITLVLSPHYDGRYPTDLFVGSIPVGRWNVAKRKNAYSVTLDLARFGHDVSLLLHHRRTDPWGRALRVHAFLVDRPNRSLAGCIAALFGASRRATRDAK